MTYYQFVQAVEEKIKKEVDDPVSVRIHTAVKNNGMVRKGLLLVEKGVNISPTIYLEEYYQQFQKGNDFDDIIFQILRLYHEVRFQKSFEDQHIRAYEQIKERIVYHLINKKKNERMIADIPYVNYLDMAIVFYALIEINSFGTATMLIKNEHMDYWNVDNDEIFRRACGNTEKLLPYDFKTMGEVIAELSQSSERAGEEQMYVLSNGIRSFGAATILYQDSLKKIGSLLNENYYILPSSVHEVIIIPESASPGKAALLEMVKEINETQVDAEEVLADNVYYYNRTADLLAD